MSKGLPSLQIVGMGNKAIDESRDRVRSAIKKLFPGFSKRKNNHQLSTGRVTKRRISLRSPQSPYLYYASTELTQPKRRK